MRILLVVVLVACGGSKPSKTEPARIDPPLTPLAMRESLCKSCNPEHTCQILVGGGPEGSRGTTTATCGPLPASCHGKTHCLCFPALKGCRCEHTRRGFDVECPAP